MSWKKLIRTKSIERILREAGYRNASKKGALSRKLGVLDLTGLGVAAILGAGVFSTIGNAAADGGPAVTLLFIFTGIACAFSALCYAEFASAIPTAGSAYTYAYASFGELVAWIIGWDLIMEYAIGNIAVAISWSEYFTGWISQYGVNVPAYLTMDFLSASRGYDQVHPLIVKGKTLVELAGTQFPLNTIKAYQAWAEAPRFFGIPIVCDLPALFITVLITWIVFIGIEESRKISNILVALKLIVVFLVIIAGISYINPSNWVPFAPNGLTGILKGVSGVFFAYIGFDAISTTAEECKDPQRDLPKGMIYSLVICTVLYVLVALVLTGIVNYQKLGVADPLAFIFGPEGAHIPWLTAIIEVSAIIALSTVLLVFQIGQPRIWMVMSRDGLLPPIFSSIHKKYRTPWFSTLVAGAVVAMPSLFMNLTEVTDLTSIGTLFAFILVCAGILKFELKGQRLNNKFKTPYISSKYVFPILVVICLAVVILWFPERMNSFFSMTSQEYPHLPKWEILLTKIPMVLFLILIGGLTYLCFVKSLSLIPVLGLTSCSYLMTELGITNWIRFGLWLIAGLFIYFLYGVKNSKLNNPT